MKKQSRLFHTLERWTRPTLLGLTALMISALYILALLGPVSLIKKRTPSVVAATTLEQSSETNMGLTTKRAPKAGAGLVKKVSIKNASTPCHVDQQGHTVCVDETSQLEQVFDAHGYCLKGCASGEKSVPRVYLASLPKDFSKRNSTASKREVFLKTMLPLILKTNEDIRRERGLLLQIKTNRDQGKSLTPGQRKALMNLATKYKLARPSVDELLKRVDEIPPSLALSQAIVETGWGVSHAAGRKNSPFGVMASSTKVKKYDSLEESVRGYIHNLNTHNAYAKMRQIRSELRGCGEHLCGIKLADGLQRYSELGQGYIARLRGVIRQHDLKKFDQSQLSKTHKRGSL
ncbi:MAG: glucosaminidase domain-containing protein [Holosporales bacterium]